MDAGDLMSQNQRQRAGEISIDYMQIAMTDTAGSDGKRGAA